MKTLKEILTLGIFCVVLSTLSFLSVLSGFCLTSLLMGLAEFKVESLMRTIMRRSGCKTREALAWRYRKENP